MITTFNFEGEPIEDLTALHARLSWFILEAKYLYYHRDASPIPDHEYDQIEKLYDKMSSRLGVQPTASDMVGFDKSRPACREVAARWDTKDPQEILPKAELFMEAVRVFGNTVDAAQVV